jgi:TatD DNase family protein
MELFDTHAHLDDPQFDSIRAAVFQRCAAAGVSHVIVVGTTRATSEKCIDIARRFSAAHAAVGIQPNYCSQAEADDWTAIERLAADSATVAIGETGLDRYWDYTPFALQQEYFARHIELSLGIHKPFIIHMRDCGQDIIEMLQRYHPAHALRGVMHSFTGDWPLAKQCLDLGLFISFAGMVTYKKADDLRQVAKKIPAERLLIETDAPYLSPHPLRGQRPNEPALIVHTARCLAEVRGVEPEELARVTTENARRLFLPPATEPAQR